MKRILFFLAAGLLIAVPSLKAQEKGIRLTRFEGQTITALSVNSGFDVELSQGGRTGATVEIDAELEKYLVFNLNDGVLTIGMSREFQNKSSKWWGRKLLRRAIVVVSSLDKLTATTSSHVTASGSFTGSDVVLKTTTSGSIDGLDMTATGTLRASATTSGRIAGCTFRAVDVSTDASTSGRIDVSVETSTVSAGTTTSGRIVLAGQAAKGDFTGTTSGSVEADRLLLQEVRAHMTTSAKATVRVSGTARLTASTSGSIRYTGGSTSVSQRSSTGGRISSY